MSKIDPLVNIENILTGSDRINSNYDKIEAAFENTLSRDGSTPNQMEADLDLNSYRILNAGELDVDSLTINGMGINPTGNVEGPSSSVVDNFASFDGTNGQDIKDSGKSASDFATAAQGSKADSAQQPPAEGPFVDGDKTKLDGIEAAATADQTGAEIKSLYEAEADTNAFTDGYKLKIDSIEDGADVTDTANVTAAGALMDSEVTNLADVKAFDPADYATAAQGALAVDTFADLASLTASDIAVGGYVRVIKTGWVLKRVSSSGDYDYTGSGGVQLDLVTANVNFPVRNAANAGVIGTLPDGWFGFMGKEMYAADSSLTGTASCTNDLSKDGLKPAGQATPEHFGAKGDGVTVDTVAIQSALTNCLSVLFDEKTYLADDMLLFQSGQHISGKGPTACIKFATTGLVKTMFKPVGPFGTVGTPNSYSADDVVFENITLDANHTDVADFDAGQMIIAAISCRRMRINNVHFKNPMADAIYLGAKFGSEKSTVIPNDIKIDGNRFTGSNINRNGVTVITGSNIGITNNHFTGMTKDDMPGPIDLEPNALTDLITNVQIHGNTFTQCKNGIATYISGAAYDDLTTIQNISIIGNNFSDQLVISPYVAEVQAYISLYNASNLVVQGNNLHNASDIGMAFTFVSRLTATGNNVYDPELIGIRIEDIQNSKVDDNFVSLKNDQFNSTTCIGIEVDTKGSGATNYAFVNGSLADNTLICTASSPSNNYALILTGNVTGVDVSGTAKGFANGLYLGTRAGVSPTLNKFDFDVSQCTTPYASNFTTGTPKSLPGFNLGEGVTSGTSAFSAKATKVLTGLPVLTTSQVRVTRMGTTGLGNDLTATVPTAGQLTITSSAVESGSFVWEILQL